MKRFLAKFTAHYPVIVLLLTTLTLTLLNYKTGTLLTGWDNLHPEFYPSMNIKRSIFAVWQEYQSLGLLGGMGHASDLLRQLLFASLLPLISENFIRFGYTMLTLFLGGLGAYYLSQNLDQEGKKNKIIHLTVGLFYMLNLATIQMFYAPFEAFIAHFASLPYVLLATIYYLKKSTKKALLLTSLVFLLTTPQAYIPTLFVASMIAVAIISLSTLVLSRKKKFTLVRIAKLIGIIFATNAFWLLPFAYFTLTSADVNVNSKINQMATENIYLQNKEFGQIEDVALLKGFWFNNIDVDLEGNFSFMLAPWRTHMEGFLPQIAGYILFLLMLTGVISTFIKKDKKLLPFSILFIFAFTMLTTATPPFEQANEVFRKIPLFGQAFRFPFTKFSLLTALMYGLFLGVGIKTLISLMKHHAQKHARYIASLTVILFIIIIALPAFRGYLFYEKEQLTLPQEYQDTFDFFAIQDPSTRIANLPQHTFWGWNFYNWGYGGSGFLWYGIKQPIVDRAFDVWSKDSENYYYEISQALYSNDPVVLKNVLNKYQIDWILLDENIIYPNAPKSLSFEETKNLLNQDYIDLAEKFGNISIYKVTHPNTPQDFLTLQNNLPTVNGYIWGEYDVPLEYTPSYLVGTKNFDYYLPLRTLHTGRLQKDQEFKMIKEGNTLTFTTQVPPSTKKRQLFVPQFNLEEVSIPTRIQKRINDNGTVDIIATPQLPIIRIGNIQTVSSVKEILLATLPQDGQVDININGLTDFTLSKESDTLVTNLSQRENNLITLTFNNNTQTVEITPNELTEGQSTQNIDIPENATTLEIKVITPDDNYHNYIAPLQDLKVRNCDNYRNGKFTPQVLNGKLNLIATNATACATSYSRTLTHNTGYAVFIEAQNKKGRPLHFWILNDNNDVAPIDTYLSSSKNISTSSFILPPQEEFGKGYSLHFDNISIGRQATENTILSAEITPIPYNFLKYLTIVSEDAAPSSSSSSKLTTTHPNESLYTAQIVSTNEPSLDPTYLTLSQSFDPGWTAYEVNNLGWKEKLLPFLSGKKLAGHVKVNNYSNGWKLPELCQKNSSTCQFVIVFLPQYLEYLGFVVLIAFTFLTTFFLLRKDHHIR